MARENTYFGIQDLQRHIEDAKTNYVRVAEATREEIADYTSRSKIALMAAGSIIAAKDKDKRKKQLASKRNKAVSIVEAINVFRLERKLEALKPDELVFDEQIK